jgi:hypothetical protein
VQIERSRAASDLHGSKIIRRIKSAAALPDTTASPVMEEAAAEWFERHQDGNK